MSADEAEGPLRRDRRAAEEAAVPVTPREPAPRLPAAPARPAEPRTTTDDLTALLTPWDGTEQASARGPWRTAVSLAVAIVSLCISFFVWWGIPLALYGAGLAFSALRLPGERRVVAMWALVLSLCATVFSIGWLMWGVLAWEASL